MKKFIIFPFLFALILTSCEKEQIIYVADHYDDANQKLMLVKLHEKDDWKAVNVAIEGFQYEEGFTYKLKVKGKKIDFLNASFPKKLQLIAVMSKEKVKNIEPQSINSMDGAWEVIAIKDFENTTGRNPTFKINGSEISGNNACNSFGGNIQKKDNQNIKFAGLFSTKMFCVETAQLETQFMNALNKVEKYQNTGDILNLLDVDGKILMVCTTMKSKVENDNSTQKESEKKVLITYSTRSRNFVSDWTFDGDKIVFEKSRPTKETKIITLDKKEKEKISQYIKKWDFKKLETLAAPSKEHQSDGAHAIVFQLTSGGKKYVVPTFDNGNPPVYIKELVDYIEKLLSK